MSQVLYGERSWNPPAQTVELTEERLRRGGRTTPLDELNLGATAEAYRRGYWPGGGGAERPLDRLAESSGIVPLTRVTGTTTPLKVREAAAFARAFGELAVRRCGGPGQVAALADRARAEGVPLWIARRLAGGPAGPVAVAVDRRLVRVDVWGPHAPAVRIRAPHGFHEDVQGPSKGCVRRSAGPRRSSCSGRSCASPEARWRRGCRERTGCCGVRTPRVRGCCATIVASPC
ncbi:hypothetical protein [[Kitasatospora] papulosa]|uniref:hypothetical protein n=1 Tax=[Kitasatospora] papulosa TaxID=1464011 RepID=UPI00380A34A7